MLRMCALIFLTLLVAGRGGAAEDRPVWPPPPDASRIEFVREIQCADLKPQRGWLGSIAGLIGGSSEDENLQLPFDIVVVEGKLYMTFQETPALVEVDPESKRFQLHADKERPFDYPLGVCAAAGDVFVTDSGNGTVYRFDGDDVEPLVTEGLKRPTGIAFLPDPARLYVVDTEIHGVKVFDLDGKLFRRGGNSDCLRRASERDVNPALPVAHTRVVAGRTNDEICITVRIQIARNRNCVSKLVIIMYILNPCDHFRRIVQIRNIHRLFTFQRFFRRPDFRQYYAVIKFLTGKGRTCPYRTQDNS